MRTIRHFWLQLPSSESSKFILFQFIMFFSIKISHWGGNVAVEEHVEIVNKGAKLKGSFSRLDFQIDRRGGKQPIVKSIKV